MLKSFQCTVKDVTEKGIITVAANAFNNIDADNQISMPGSYNKTISENFNRLRWFLNHDRNILLGVPLKAKEESSLLVTEGQLNMQKQVSIDVLSDYKLYAEHGRSLEHSVGVTAVKADDWKRGQPQQVYEWKWWEYSTLTSWGANENTHLLGMKGINDYADALQWLDICLRKGTYTDERFKQIESQISILKSLISEPDKSTQKETEPTSEEKFALAIKNYLSRKN